MTEAELAVHNCYFGLSIFPQAPTQEDDGMKQRKVKCLAFTINRIVILAVSLFEK